MKECKANQSYEHCHIHHDNVHGCIGCGNYRDVENADTKYWTCSWCHKTFTAFDVVMDKNLIEHCPFCNTALGGSPETLTDPSA